jgi:hypothetical protein
MAWRNNNSLLLDYFASTGASLIHLFFVLVALSRHLQNFWGTTNARVRRN